MVRGRRGGGEFREAEHWGFDPRGAERRLRSCRTTTHGSNNKNLADLPASPPPSASRFLRMLLDRRDAMNAQGEAGSSASREFGASSRTSLSEDCAGAARQLTARTKKNSRTSPPPRLPGAPAQVWLRRKP